MKKNILFLFCFLFFCYAITAQHVLHFEGNISNRNTSAPLKKAKIELFNNDSLLLSTVYTNAVGKYNLEVPLDDEELYLVKVSYPKFVHKYFSVSTYDIPEQSLEMDFPVIEANLDLFEPVANVNYDLLNEVLNKYYYDVEKDNYAYDKKCLASVLLKLEILKLTEEKVKQQNTISAALAKRKQMINTLIKLGVILVVSFGLLIGFIVYNKRKTKNSE